MTPDLPTRIQLVLAECERIIAASEKATDGPWRYVQDGGICGKGYSACIWTSKGPGRGAVATTAPWSSITEQNIKDSEFIAASRTFCPAAAVGIRDLIIERSAGEVSVEALDRLTSPFAYLWSHD